MKNNQCLYHIAGYFRRTINKLNFKVLFILLKCQVMIDLFSMNFIVLDVMFFGISKNKNPLKISRYTVAM